MTASTFSASRLRRVGLGLFCALVMVLPLLPVPEFWITQLNYVGLYAMVSLGLVLLTGVSGLTSFGQAAFVGVGAYTTAFMATKLALSPWLALFVGIGLTVAVAVILGALTLYLDFINMFQFLLSFLGNRE